MIGSNETMKIAENQHKQYLSAVSPLKTALLEVAFVLSLAYAVEMQNTTTEELSMTKNKCRFAMRCNSGNGKACLKCNYALYASQTPQDERRGDKKQKTSHDKGHPKKDLKGALDEK